MDIRHYCFHFWVALFCLVLAANGQAAMLEARATGDLNADFVNDINDTDAETGSPVAQSTVQVAGFGTLFGIAFDYAAAADIANSSLGAYASLTNNGAAIFGELPLLQSRATFSDTLTFESTLAGDYDVTFVMDVHGEIDNGGTGNALGNAILAVGGDASGSDFGSYSTDGMHADTLAVTVTLNGDATLDITGTLTVSILGLAAGGTSFGDFRGGLGDNGADILLILPNGVDLSESESGAYDTNVVPIPAAAWLLVSGLVGCLGLARRGKGAST